MQTELLDVFETENVVGDISPSSQQATSEVIGFKNAAFTWSSEDSELSGRSHRAFQLRVTDELHFKRGRVNLIIGPTGSGKTSLLMALLGLLYHQETMKKGLNNAFCRRDALYSLKPGLLV